MLPRRTTLGPALKSRATPSSTAFFTGVRKARPVLGTQANTATLGAAPLPMRCSARLQWVFRGHQRYAAARMRQVGLNMRAWRREAGDAEPMHGLSQCRRR